jgi:predicted phage tail component-like protein
MKVTYNDYDFSKKFVTTVLSRPLPELRPASTVVDGADGESFDNLTVGKREVSIRLVATNRNPRQLQLLTRELMGALGVHAQHRLRIDDERDESGYQLYRRAYVKSADYREFVRSGVFDVTFEQVDPFLYGKESAVKLSPNTTETVKVGGNAPAYPTAVAKGVTGDHYTFRIMPDGDFVRVRATALGGTNITVDCEAQRFTSSKTDVKAGLAVGSRFFAIEGTVRLAATHKTVVTWTERWL